MNSYFRNLRKIEFTITNACTGRCKHCSEAEHLHAFPGEHIDADAAVAALREAAARYPIKTVMTFGGEALLYPQTVYRIHSAARDLDIPQRQVITNGFFSKDPSDIAEVAGLLHSCGVNDVLVSVDAFHQETIPLDIVKRFALAAQKSGILVRLSPAWLVCPEDDNPYNRMTKSILSSFDGTGIGVGDGNIVFAQGNARKYLSEYLKSENGKNPYAEDPFDIRCLSFSANGDVLDGNIYKSSITEIMCGYAPQLQ